MSNIHQYTKKIEAGTPDSILILIAAAWTDGGEDGRGYLRSMARAAADSLGMTVAQVKRAAERQATAVDHKKPFVVNAIETEGRKRWEAAQAAGRALA